MGRLASLPVGAFVMAFRASAVVRLAARVPGIKFPTRRLPDGTRVSDLPAADAKAFVEQATATVATSTSTGTQKKSTPGFAMARPRPSPIPFPRPDPPRKTMSVLEMQVVELGGADP